MLYNFQRIWESITQHFQMLLPMPSFCFQYETMLKAWKIFQHLQKVMQIPVYKEIRTFCCSFQNLYQHWRTSFYFYGENESLLSNINCDCKFREQKKCLCSNIKELECLVYNIIKYIHMVRACIFPVDKNII